MRATTPLQRDATFSRVTPAKRFAIQAAPFIGATLAVALYLAVAYRQNGEFGFPLDDAWIHQVYARNLGTRFEFSFFAGQPSAGSTSPLWALVLGAGYALGVDYRVWTILLGVLFLGCAGWMARRGVAHLTGDAWIVDWIAPLFVVLEWHLVWAAASGMEIVLFVFLSLALVESMFARLPALAIGLLAGLLALTRPEGVLLAGLVGLGFILQRLQSGASATVSAAGDGDEARSANRMGGGRSVLIAALAFAAGFLVLLLPYVLFNLQASGTLLPNTFYAKASEYAALTANTNFFARWLSLYRQPLIGAQLLLVPGLLYGSYALARRKEWTLLLPALWILGLPALYAWRLPVEYQFGRYMMPIIPFVIVYGIVGTALLFQKISLRLLRRVWALATGVLVVVFLVLGAGYYAEAVAIVNCEMVAAAKWTRAHVPAGALIAAHDIGAQGYFDEHPILDLAGLVSPEVIPFIRDEVKLGKWLEARDAQYAIFFPTWYPKLAGEKQAALEFSTGCALTRELGEENMGVYRLE